MESYPSSPDHSFRGFNLTLKICLFATGSAAIVAEYTLATLASYLLGNAIFQWTIIISLMLFAMGIGSRYTRRMEVCLLDRYIVIEFGLSILCSFSALFCYSIAAFTPHTSIMIYGTACAIGFLTGMEIPLITRINDNYEPLKVNISSVMEYDYYGALAGGGLFAFILLPYLGLTYTPIFLGATNLLVAGSILWKFPFMLFRPKLLRSSFPFVLILILIAVGSARPIVLFSEQQKYRDPIVYQKQTRYQKIVVTQWKNHYWLFLNGSEQFSTYDEERYHEPLIHPALSLVKEKKDVLVLGGGDGLAVREILKYPEIRSVTLVDLDPAMTHLAQTNEIFLKINRSSLLDPRVRVFNQDAYKFAKNDVRFYDVIILDLPDPKTISLSLLYSTGFYKILKRHLKPYGVLVTQATSPLYAPKAFICILKTLRSAGFSVIPYRNEIPTLGEWGWVMGVKQEAMPETKLRDQLDSLDFAKIKTRFLNHEAVVAMTRFGKGLFDKIEPIEVNTASDHVILEYYRNGDWDVY